MVKNYFQKTIFPHRYSKNILWLLDELYCTFGGAMIKRLEIEKDVLVLVTGDTGSGKSNLVGNICFKFAEKTDNFVMNDGNKMFIAEEDFIIDPDEFAVKMITKAGNVLWIDEARDGVSRRKLG